MTDLLRELGTPFAVIVGLTLAGYLVRQGSGLILESRMKLRDEAISREIEYMDTQLSEFYLPLRERLATLNGIFGQTQAWIGPDGYENTRLAIDSDHPNVLRDIVVRRIFVPLNHEIERLILDKAKYRRQGDRTNYGALLQHLVLWRALEQSRQAGEIRSYNAEGALEFPSTEAEVFHDTVAQLLDTRDRLRRDLLGLRSPTHQLNRRSDSNA